MAMDRYEELEKKASALQEENARLRAQIERLQLDNSGLKQKVAALEEQRAQAHGRFLGQEERDIVDLLAQAPHGLTAHDVALRLSMPPARAEHFLNRLSEDGHIAASGNYMTGHNTYHLPSRGREHGVSHRFV